MKKQIQVHAKAGPSKLAFTLVELIVVITILAILWTIAFISLQWYSRSTRNSVRISDLSNINKMIWVKIASTWKVPAPDDYIEITASWTVLNYQWIAWEKVLDVLWVYNWWIDPLDETYYIYSTNSNLTKYQLLWFLEWESVASFNMLETTNAEVDLSSRTVETRWDELWIILDATTNEPVTETVDVLNTTETYKAVLSNEDIITWTWNILVDLIHNKDCKRIKDLSNKSLEDWIYKINPTWVDEFDVYCDMNTDWWWWTYVTMLADTTTRNLFDTWNSNKITSITENISSRWKISDVWIDNYDKDIMLKCLTDKIEFKNYEIPFFIYWYKKSDITHLEKNDKQSKIFSSENLNGKWNWNEFILNTLYDNSASEQSMYLNTNNEENLFMLWYSAFIAVYNRSDMYKKSPVYTNITSMNYYISSSNYCMSAIR